MFFSTFVTLLAALSPVLAAPTTQDAESAQPVSKRCVHSATDRACWGDFSLSTDYYDIDAVPNTGVTREYWFDVQNGTAAPDGVERIVLTVNGSFPGPTIIADWGDTIGECYFQGINEFGEMMLLLQVCAQRGRTLRLTTAIWFSSCSCYQLDGENISPSTL